MKALVIGGSAAGIYYSLLLKQKLPEAEVLLFEKEDKLARKLYATGNGHCNILNRNLVPEAYNHKEFMKALLDKYDYAYLEATLLSLGIELTYRGDLVYPLSFNAASLVGLLEANLRKANVEIHTGEKAIDYTAKDGHVTLTTSKETYEGDVLVVATGGMSSPKLGSDGSFFDVLYAHGYKVGPFRPGLCPAKTVEHDTYLDGVRHRAEVRAYNAHQEIYVEDGEVLFRKNGLSGICIFNALSAIERQSQLFLPSFSVDLFPDVSTSELLTKLMESEALLGEEFLSAYLEKPLIRKVMEVSKVSSLSGLGKKDFYALAKAMKGLIYVYDLPDGYDHSQVTIGGVNLENLDKGFASVLEQNVYVIGEAVDIDGYCGGYNLAFALLSAVASVNHISG